MRARGGQAEDVGSELHRRVALRAAAGHAQRGDRHAAAFFDAFLALAQRVCQSFQDRAVQVRAVVHVAEADHRAFRFRAGLLDAGRPVRLQHQAHRTGRHCIHQLVEQFFGCDTAFGGLHLFQVTELFLEPVDHPVAAEDLHFGAVGIGHGGGVRRYEGGDFQIFFAGGVDGGGGAVAQAADMRLQAAGADHFARLVRRCRDQRRACRNAGVGGRLFGDLADHGAGRDQFRQHVARHCERLPFPVMRRGPFLALVVEGQVGDLRAGGVDEAAA